MDTNNLFTLNFKVDVYNLLLIIDQSWIGTIYKVDDWSVLSSDVLL